MFLHNGTWGNWWPAQLRNLAFCPFAGMLQNLKQASVTVSTQAGSSCAAGQEFMGEHCYRCAVNAINPFPGGVCTACIIPNSAPNPAATACVCAEGFTAETSGNGLLLRCVKQGLSCSSRPNSIINIRGDGCSCKPGFTTANSVCSLSCSSIPGSQAAADAAACECRPGYTPLAAKNGYLLACIPPPAAQSGAIGDTATVMSGFYLIIPVLDNDLGTIGKITAVSNCSSGGMAAVVPAGAAGNNGSTDIVSYVSKPGKTSKSKLLQPMLHHRMVLGYLACSMYH
jgi:hypothetical protein